MWILDTITRTLLGWIRLITTLVATTTTTITKITVRAVRTITKITIRRRGVRTHRAMVVIDRFGTSIKARLGRARPGEMRFERMKLERMRCGSQGRPVPIRALLIRSEWVERSLRMRRYITRYAPEVSPGIRWITTTISRRLVVGEARGLARAGLGCSQGNRTTRHIFTFSFEYSNSFTVN